MFRSVNLFALVLFFSTFLGCVFAPAPSHLMRAEEFRKNGKFQEAINEYQIYIEERLAKKNYPPDQSPYFYYVLIGDSYLGLGKPDDAEKAYGTALEHDTDKSLVAGKYRTVADWFATRGEYDTAIDVLRRHRELDPLLFDIDIDEFHKKMIAAEDKSEDKEASPKEPRY